MKHLLIATLCLSLAGLAACHKHDTNPKQYSTWIVNGQDTFHTNNVDTSIDCNPDNSYCRAVLMSNDNYNWFTLSFAFNQFPDTGKFELYTIPGGGIVPCAISFYYNNIFYYHTPSTTDTIYASSNNDKATYSLSPCWFINYDDPVGDSILIQGTFNIP